MRRSCTLIITYNCNLNCSYCYEQFKSSDRMSIITAKEIITRELNYCQEKGIFKDIEFTFIGGEPLMHFGLIKEIVEWSYTIRPFIPFYFFVPTNGTLLKKRNEGMV